MSPKGWEGAKVMSCPSEDAPMVVSTLPFTFSGVAGRVLSAKRRCRLRLCWAAKELWSGVGLPGYGVVAWLEQAACVVSPLWCRGAVVLACRSSLGGLRGWRSMLGQNREWLLSDWWGRVGWLGWAPNRVGAA